MSGSASAIRVAVDAGSLVTKVAVADRPSGPSVAEPRLHTEAAGPDRERAALAAALAVALPGAQQARATPAGGDGIQLSLVVPDAWLDGTAEGARRQEALRHLAEDQLSLTEVCWAGQLAAVAALAASQRGFAEPGRYLICDIGGNGVRVAACEVTSRTILPLAVRDVPGGGWLDFDAAVRTTLEADSDPGLATWYRSAEDQHRRATLVFDRARNAPEFLDARAYSLIGVGGAYELTAGQAVRCFASTADRIRAGSSAVLGGAAPTVAVLTGGLAWFPQAHQVLAEAAGRSPDVLGPEAAVLGAMLLAGGEARLAPHGLPPVTLPAHRISGGRLEEISLPLPWTDSFASPDCEPMVLEDPELTLDIGSRRVTLPVPGLTRGHYRIGVRPSWSGTGVVVLRARRTPQDRPDPSHDVHVLPLDLQEVPDA
jgi:hypothetical protein